MSRSRRSSGSACGVAAVRALLSQHLALRVCYFAFPPSQDLPGRRISYCIVVRALWRSNDACNAYSVSIFTFNWCSLALEVAWQPSVVSGALFVSSFRLSSGHQPHHPTLSLLSPPI